MKVQQSFVIDQPRERVWAFFEDVPGVARCVPGVEAVEVLDEEHSKLRMTQAVGPMSATFDLKMRITERVPGDRMAFTAVGKAVKGAAGNVRTVNTVTLAQDGQGTKVSLESDMAMGGVLGSVGQKVIAKQAAGITEQFAAALERAISGEAPAEPATAATPSSAPKASAPSPAPVATAPSSSSWWSDPRITGLTGLSAGLGVAVIVALRLGGRR
jgi:carbon monoxide dehydrogenase subunit G